MSSTKHLNRLPHGPEAHIVHAARVNGHALIAQLAPPSVFVAYHDEAVRRDAGVVAAELLVALDKVGRAEYEACVALGPRRQLDEGVERHVGKDGVEDGLAAVHLARDEHLGARRPPAVGNRPPDHVLSKVLEHNGPHVDVVKRRACLPDTHADAACLKGAIRRSELRLRHVVDVDVDALPPSP